MNGPEIIFFEGEDAEAMRARFIELSALHSNRDKFEIAQYIFKNLKDGVSRSFQAAVVWSQDLEVLEEIRIAKTNGGVKTVELSEEQLQAKILACAEDPNLSSAEKKATLDGYRLLAETKGMIKKVVDKNLTANVGLDTEGLAKLAELLPN